MLNRRELLVRSAVAAGAVCLPGCQAKRTRWLFLSEQDAGTLAVICDQIIPADDFPSASLAGVVTYIDRQLMRHYRRHQPEYVEALERVRAISASMFGVDIGKTTALQQFDVASELERQQPQFFKMVCEHTMEGYYGSPRHGGNRDAVSWRMLGLDEPPLRGRAQYDLTTEQRP